MSTFLCHNNTIPISSMCFNMIIVWEINNASSSGQEARLIMTNTKVDELVADNNYLIVDKFVSYFKVKGKRRIFSCE